MWQYRPTEELYHYGVPGMKWGVRKRQRSADSAEVKQIRKKRIKEMSNQELKTANNRLQLERTYKDLSKKPYYSNAKKVAKEFIAGAALVTGIVGAAATYKKVGNQALSSIGNWVFKDLGRIM